DLGRGALAAPSTVGVLSPRGGGGPRCQEVLQLGVGGYASQVGAELTSDRKTAEIPAHVLTQVTDALELPVVLHEQLGVAQDDAGDLTEGGFLRDGFPAHGGGQFGEQ